MITATCHIQLRWNIECHERMNMKIEIDDYELSELIMQTMYDFFREVGISWLYHLRKKDTGGFKYNRFRLPTNRIIMKLKDINATKA